MHRSGIPAGAANSEAVKAQAALVEALRNPTLYDYVVTSHRHVDPYLVLLLTAIPTRSKGRDLGSGTPPSTAPLFLP